MTPLIPLIDSVRVGGVISRLLLAGLALGIPSAHAQERVAGNTVPVSEVNGRKQARAVRVPDGSIRLDGRLDDEVWQLAPPITDFVQKEPVEGAPPSDDIDVRLVYDNAALYVGARLSSEAPIQAPMGRRDEGDQAEHLLVSLDAYLDRRTAATFGVTASGVRLDRYYATDNDWDDDEGFDPVWQARTSVDETGWSAEFWIPFSQLRFNERSPQVWGMNIERWVPTRNEEIFWEMVPRTEEGWASRFGDLHGIDGIRPSRRIELLPYVSTSSRLVGDLAPGDPFNGGINPSGGIGLDAKLGLGPNLTLEATINPDFGQVEADPAEVNLSAFETFFQERRPFFLEGNDRLEGSVNNYYYSRRIGAQPQGEASGEFVDYPSTSTILGAAKLTGRLSSGTSVGMLAAVTSHESAQTFEPPQSFDRTGVAPTTTYGVARVLQEFGPPGSTFGLMTTMVRRDLAVNNPLAERLVRNALTLSGDSLLRLRDGEYELGMYGGVTYVDGDAAAIARLQRASARHLQRPDADYVDFDPERTSLSGVKAGARLERRNGRHWLWETGVEIESPEFETNDIGRLSSADAMQARGELQYRETIPGRWWRAYSLSLSPRFQWNYGGDRQSARLEAETQVTWPNFWETEFSLLTDLRSQDGRLTRGGPSMQVPRAWRARLQVESSEASRTRGALSLAYGRDEDGGLGFDLGTELTWQPGMRWQLGVSPEYEREARTQQYVDALEGGRAATFDNRYIFGHIDRSTLSTEVRLTYTFRPDLTLDLYAEPFAASGQYSSLGELARPRTRDMLRYGTGGTTMDVLPDGSRRITDGQATFVLPDLDFNVQSFRSNVVLRWEWRAGSTLYLVWQQDRSADETLGRRATVGDMFSSLGSTGDHFFVVKASFWFSPS